MQRNGFNPCFGGMAYNSAYNPAARPSPHFGGGRPVQYGPCFGAPAPQPTFQPNSCFLPASALRRPMPQPNPCNAAPMPHQYDPCFH
uniref:Uncharacterized protein n=1 Tax=Picea sitchensis TaxID=3332 RepID=A9NM09_PICSI|nr:unknown [Picea sitchensis]